MHDAPVVFTSTGGALYGDEAPMPTCEERIPAPLSPYGASKWAAEAYVEHVVAARRASRTPSAGSATSTARARARTARPAWSRSSPTISTPAARRRCTATASRRATTSTSATSSRRCSPASGRSGTYNIATGVETDVLSVWKGCRRSPSARRSRRGDPASLEPELADLRPGELQHSRLDIARAERELGWRRRCRSPRACAAPTRRSSRTSSRSSRRRRVQFVAHVSCDSTCLPTLSRHESSPHRGVDGRAWVADLACAARGIGRGCARSATPAGAAHGGAQSPSAPLAGGSQYGALDARAPRRIPSSRA